MVFKLKSKLYTGVFSNLSFMTGSVKTLMIWWLSYGAKHHNIVHSLVKSSGLQGKENTHNNMVEDTEKCYTPSWWITSSQLFKPRFQGIFALMDVVE